MDLWRRPRTGLVLSGGGSRGLAHIGVLRVLEQEKIPITLLVGSSMGGIIAAAYAAGKTPDEMDKIAQEMAKLRNLVTLLDVGLPQQGLFSGGRVKDFLAQLFAKDLTFDDLRIPLALMAVDLLNGEEVVMREGAVLEAVRATMAFPGVFDPLVKDGRRLADGGILNDFPVDVARRMGAEAVIGVDVGIDHYDLSLADNPKTNMFTRITHTVWRAQSLSMRKLQELKVKEARPDLIIHPEIPVDITVFNGFHRASEIIRAGEAAAVLERGKIRKIALRKRLLPEVNRFHTSDPEFTV